MECAIAILVIRPPLDPVIVAGYASFKDRPEETVGGRRGHVPHREEEEEDEAGFGLLDFLFPPLKA